MAILHIDGFRTYDRIRGVNSPIFTGSGYGAGLNRFPEDSMVIRQGRRAAKLSHLATVPGYSSYYYRTPEIEAALQAGATVGIAVLFDRAKPNYWSSVLPLLGVFNSASTLYAGIWIGDSPGTFRAQTHSGVWMDFPSVDPQPDTWYYLEVELNNSTVSFYLDGVLFHSEPFDHSQMVDVRFAVSNTNRDSSYGACFTDFYVSDLNAPNAGRLGPIETVLVDPTSDGAELTGFSPTPVGAIHETVNGHVGGNGTDEDTSYMSGTGVGGGFSILGTSEKAFAGNALGWFSQGVLKAAAAPGLEVEFVATDGANEVVSAGEYPPVPDFMMRTSEVFTTLPGGAALTQANFELMEFGLRLKNP